MQIPLYIKYDSGKLMNFLQSTENYPPFKAAELCKAAKLHKEQAYLYIKTGKVDEAVNVLVENCSDNMKEVVDLAVQFGINDKLLWESILAKASQDKDKISQLLEYVDVYQHPSRFIDAYDDDLEIGEIRQPLIDTFDRLESYTTLLTSAVNAGEKAK